MFKIYKKNEVIVEGESPLTITGIDPNTEVDKGTYQVVRVDDGVESERVDVPAFKTLPIKVETVTVAPKTNNLIVGATRQLNATVEPSNATDKTVNYETDDGSVATVNSSGLVTAVGEGATTITATAGGKTDTATVNVTSEEGE